MGKHSRPEPQSLLARRAGLLANRLFWLVVLVVVVGVIVIGLVLGETFDWQYLEPWQN